MKTIIRTWRITLLFAVIVWLFPGQAALAQRAETVSIQSQQGKVTFPDISVPFSRAQVIDEIEPNNTVEQVQVIQDVSPVTINGNAEVEDEGDIIIDLEGGVSDDLEDLFVIRLTEAGLNLQLSGLSADCDLYVIDETVSNVVTASLTIGTDDEIIDAPNLEPGIYLIGVSIYDDDPGGNTATAYTLTITGAISTDIVDEVDVPTQFVLGQNYPNPFNPATRIQYEVPSNITVRLEVFNLLGRKVRTLVDEGEAAGIYSVTWDGTTDTGASVATGVYLYRLQAGTFSQSRTMVFLQ